MSRIFKFSADLRGMADPAPYQTYPIYDDFDDLIGAFTVKQGDVIQGFVGGAGYPLALAVSTDETLFFTPVDGFDGRVCEGRLTWRSTGARSVPVNYIRESTDGKEA
jgi:hypothetical protein